MTQDSNPVNPEIGFLPVDPGIEQELDSVKHDPRRLSQKFPTGSSDGSFPSARTTLASWAKAEFG